MKSLTVREIFLEALEMATPESRAAYLQAACGGDIALRRKVDELLKEHYSNDSLLAGPALEGERASEARPPASEAPAQMIGRYKLLEKIGEGGFGEVWMAEQREPVKRRVALKIIKLGMDSRQIVARFEAERQALAMMDHANIARIFDADVTDNGRLYFVMELVRGIKITEYCDQNQLPTRERLKLFILVCQAIQHAHQKGIIHRDIKPSNILVTLHDGVPVPKVIDFGIAKATQGELTDKTVFTQFQQFIGTPAYISPEQAEMSGLDIDTRADIYSLGVLLYELLVGQTPFDAKEMMQGGLDALRQIVREKEPLRPSTKLNTLQGDARATAGQRRQTDVGKLVHQLQGDLDWIVMKCLEKDRTRRYDTANGLALDIQRHLSNEPVTARPPSNTYRFKKLVLRNKTVFLGSAIALTALLAAVIQSHRSAVQARRAEHEEKLLRADAVAAQKKAEAVTLQAERNLYAADMLLAYQADSEGNWGRARALLQKYAISDDGSQLDLRDWEWWHLSHRVRGGEFRILRGHTHEVPVTLFMPDGKRIFSGGTDGTFRFWNVEDGKELLRWKFEGWCRSAVVSRDGNFVAAPREDDPRLLIFAAATGQVIRTHTNGTFQAGACFSPNGKFLAVTDERHVYLYDVPSFEEIKRITRINGSQSFLKGIAFSPDSKSIVYAPNNDAREIRLHRISDGAETVAGTLARGDPLSVAFSPDGRWLAVAEDGLHIFDLAQRKEGRTLSGHREQVCKLVFSPNGQFLASASGDQTIRLWETKDWNTVQVFRGHEHEVQALDFSPDGRWLVSGSKDESVRIWDTRQVERNEQRPIDDFFWDRYSRQSTGLVISYPTNQHAVLDFVEFREGPRQVCDVTNFIALAFSGNLGTFAMSFSNRTIEVRGGTSWRLKNTLPIPNVGRYLALSLEGALLAVSDSKDELTIFDLRRNLKILSSGPMDHPVNRSFFAPALQFEAGDKVLLRAASRFPHPNKVQVEITQVSSGKRVRITSTHKGPLTAYAMSADGSTLATAAWDGKIILWDALSGKEKATLPGQLIGFISLEFTQDGTRLAAGGWDGTITIWDLALGQQVARWQAHNRRCRWVRFLDNDQTLVSVGTLTLKGPDELEVKLWRAPRFRNVFAGSP